MFKIGHTPSVHDNATDLADYIELDCLRQSDGNASAGDLISALKRASDDPIDERHTSDNYYESALDEAFSELENRQSHSGSGYYRYPFRVSKDGQLLSYVGKQGRSEFYLYLLLATRLNMQSDRVHAGINGTELFEEVCCEVAKKYWGPRANGLVFGTARRTSANEVGNFQSAVNELCSKLREGGRFHSHSGSQPQAVDGKLDVVVWKDFSDQRAGKLIGFGQCKTGTNWEHHVSGLVPEGFFKKWVYSQPTVNPIRLFFIASRVHEHKWFDTCVNSGIFFDRCRILDFAPEMSALRAKWIAWTNAAMAANKLAIP